ncbi:MAG: MATE family efflux transporter [Lachnospiraceae bacterium]|nr:MATE family efflux transporter [Lachnospiraceae bacterium]
MKDREFYRKVISLVIPMALQNLINVGVMAADVIMLGRVGETVLSGASLGGQVFFILNLILFGTTSGACVLIAQYWGKKDTVTIEKIIGIAMRIAVLVSLLFTVVTLIIPEPIMHIFSNEPEVIHEGAKYLRIIALTYPVVAVTMVYLNLIRSIERVVISTVIYASSLLLNVVANAILIFGLLGFPAMGIQGAAIGTLCARLLELAIMVFYALKINREVQVRFTYIWKQDPILRKDFFKYSGPVIMNEMIWGLGYSANAAIIGHLGSSAVAANSVVQVTRQLSMVVVFGIGNATAIMLGKAIGEKKEAVAEEYGKRFVRLALLFGLIGGGLILLARPYIIMGLHFTGQTADYMRTFLFVMSYYAVGQAVNTVIIVGILRSGGDTRFGLILDACSMWGGSILLGFLAAFVFHLPVKVVYLFLLSDELIKIPFSLMRYRSKKWLTNITR